MFKRAKDLFYEKNNKFKIGYLEFPKKIMSNRYSNVYFDVEKFRNSRLNNPSPLEIELAKYIPNALKEVPILINDLPLWRKTLNKYKDCPAEEWFRLLHQVDFLIPEASIAIEEDSYSYHSNRVSFDKARDEYLYLEYGIEVIRFYGMEFKNNLDGLKEKLSINNPLPKLLFKESSDQYFDYLYSKEMYLYNLLLDLRKEIKLPRIKGTILTNYDLKIMNISNLTDLKNFIYWCRYYYSKEIVYVNLDVSFTELHKKYKGISGSKYNTILRQLGYL